MGPVRQGTTAERLTRRAAPFFVAALACSFPSVGRAEASPSLPSPLDRTIALDLAERNNLDLVAERLRRDVARANERVAAQIPNPSLAFLAATDTPHQEILLEQPLEIGGSRSRRKALAREEGGIVDAEIGAIARAVRRRARGAFYDVVAAREVTSQRRRALDLAHRLKEIAQTRFEAGDAARIEVLAAELSEATAESELRASDEREIAAAARLNAVLAARPGTRWDVRGSLADPLPALDPDDLVARASRSNSELARLESERRAEAGRGSLLRAERVPTVGLVFGVDLDAPGEFDVGPKGGLTLGLPLFSRNQGEIARSAATARVLDDRIAAARRAVVGDVESAYHEWRAWKTKADAVTSSILPSARRLADLAEEGYRAGKTGILAVLDAQRSAAQVELDAVESLLSLHKSFAEIEEVLGAPLD